MNRTILTIDDSPSSHTKTLVDLCAAHDIPAIFFCRGDRIEAFGDAGLRHALDQGMVLAHHSYHHQPAGEWGFDLWRDDFMAMQDRLHDLHKSAGHAWARKLYRFPYIDRGDGDRIERRFPDLANGGVIETNDRVRRMQDFLVNQGYHQDFGVVNHPLYQNPVVAGAQDCLFTYSTCDWMLTRRHQNRHRYHSLPDLIGAMDNDIWLSDPDLDHILLVHDEDEIHGVTSGLIEAMVARRFKFMERF